MKIIGYNELKKYAEIAMNRIMSKNVTHAEIYISHQVDVTIRYSNDRCISTFSDECGMACRVLNSSGGYGFSCGTVDCEMDVINVSKEALMMCSKCESKGQLILPDVLDKKIKRVDNLFDRTLVNYLSNFKNYSELLRDIMEDIIFAYNRHKHSISSLKYDIFINFELKSYLIENSLGVEAYEKLSKIYVYIDITLRNAYGSIGFYYDFDVGRYLADININSDDNIARIVAKALEFSYARKMKNTFKGELISGYVPSYELCFSIVEHANALDVLSGITYMTNMRNRKISTDKLTIIDDGTIPRGVNSSTFDDEGVPKQRITVVDRGILKNYLHNSYTAFIMHEKNNACAYRLNYQSNVLIMPSNVIIVPGAQKTSEMIEDTKKGIFIDIGGLDIDITTGRMNSPILYGYLIEKGEVTSVIKSIFITNSVMELLKNISAVSKDYRQEPGLIMPSIKISNVTFM